MDPLRELTVAVWQTGPQGEVIPNPLFHRPWDKLHSRCVEYPFAAARVGEARRVLDVGTANADPAWVAWLGSIPAPTWATDYSPPPGSLGRLPFFRADLRRLPVAAASFDLVLAVSVLEHVGLEDPQVRGGRRPGVAAGGDLDAFVELLRVLRPGGELVLTVPFGREERLIIDGSARCYCRASLPRFNRWAEPVVLDYYEYQAAGRAELYPEHGTESPLLGLIRERLLARLRRPTMRGPAVAPPARPGVVTWRRVPLEAARAAHVRHTDGVLCSVWRKRAEGA